VTTPCDIKTVSGKAINVAQPGTAPCANIGKRRRRSRDSVVFAPKRTVALKAQFERPPS
jgi:hypothetical protein